MSYEQPLDENGHGPDIHAEFMRVFNLAGELEEYARLYSPDYDEGLEDGCAAIKESIDLGGDLSTSIGFKAERTREKEANGTYGEVIFSEYTVFGSIKQGGLVFTSFPEHVQDYLREMGDYDEEFLHDETTRFAIQYSLEHSLSSDGDFMHSSNFIILVDTDEISIPEDELSDEFDYDDIAEPEEECSNAELLAILGSEDILSLAALSKQIIDEHYNCSALQNFYKEIAKLQFLNRQQHINMVRNIARQLFLQPTV